MYAVQPEDDMTEAEYLAFDAANEIKHEFKRGRVYAMTGASVRHNVITANTITHLNNQIGERDCTVTSSDVRIHIASKRAYRYPDVTVFCGDPVYVEGRVDTITNPVLLVEVLSPSTALIDRNDKLAEYTQIDSLQVYLLVSQREARVERYMRHGADEWLYTIASELDDSVALPSLDCTLALSEIYRKVSFDER